MTQGSYMMNKQNLKKYTDYEEWREISYYEYIREHIIRKRESPNFIFMYGYYISKNSKIDFKKISKLTSSPNNDTNNVPKSNTPITTTTPIKYPSIKDKKSNVSNIPNPKLDPNLYLGKALVVMTESPNYNLFGWASKTYLINGNIRTLINTGFHLDKVWYSVLFQIMVATYCMQIHKIYINNFTPEDNIYIKDINTQGSATNYWNYKIDGIDYYIPNYGYIAVIDSNYKNLKQDTRILQNVIKNQKSCKHKILAKFLDNNIPDNLFKEYSFNAFKISVDSNIYNQSFIDNGGCSPPPEVISLMNKIKKQISNDKNNEIGPYIYNFMRQFMNNRIGTYLKEKEVANIRQNESKNFKKGDIIVYEDGSSSYKFVLFIETEENGRIHILSKNNPKDTDIIDMRVPLTSLFSYSKMTPVVQNYKPNESMLNEDDLIETYVINKDDSASVN